MSTQRFFSVIIPTFNRKPFLEIAVDSVLGQTFSDFELIIIDDGSGDGTKELIESYSDSRIKYLYQKNHGVSHARNSALALAEGKYAAFLDSDDRWKKEKLEVTAKYIKNYPGIYIFHTEEIWYRKGKLLPQKKKHRKPTGHVYKKALDLCCISISTAAVNRDLFKKLGTFDENLQACEDYDFWLRAASKYEVKLIPQQLTIKDGGRCDQLSSSVWGLDRFRIIALEKMLSSGTLENGDYTATVKKFEKKCRIFASGCLKREKLELAEYYKNLPRKYSLLDKICG